MNLADTHHLEDPIERIFAYHRRVERHLAALGRLPVHLELQGIDVAASTIAAGALECFGTRMAQHQHDQERELIPLLERRIEGSGAAAFRLLRTRIEGDHRDLAVAWRDVRRPLDAIAEGLRRELPAQPLAYFRVLYALHISAEEGALHAFAQRYLLPGDRDQLSRRIHSRRAATKASSN